MRRSRCQHDPFADSNPNPDIAWPYSYSDANSNARTLANTQRVAHADAGAADVVAADKLASGAAGAGASTAGGFAFSAHHFQSRQWRNSKFSSQCCSHCYAFESDFRDAGLR